MGYARIKIKKVASQDDLKVSTDNMMNMDMVVDRLRQQLEVTKEDIERFR